MGFFPLLDVQGCVQYGVFLNVVFSLGIFQGHCQQNVGSFNHLTSSFL